MNKRIMFIAFLVALAAAGLNAQDTTTEDDGDSETASPVGTVIEEVVVTAQKREQGINDVGITVNAFSSEQLDNYGVDNAEELEKLVPGLTVTNSQPSGAPVYTIRGVGFNDFSTSSSSTVGIYNDGVSILYPVMSRGALFDIDRVEVLKGPQGDLYGRNTTAGQINMITNQPTAATEAGVKLGYGTYETVDLEGFAGGSLGDRARARVAVRSTQSGEGWQKSITRPGDELGERDELGARALFDFDLSESTVLRLNVHNYQNKSDNIAGTPTSIFGVPVAANYGNEDADWTPHHRPTNDAVIQGASATISANAGNVSITSITAFDRFERDALYDTSAVPESDADITNDSEIDVFSQELRLESTTDGGTYWTAGVFYSEDEITESYEMDFTAFQGLHFDNRYVQDSDSLAAFGHVEVPLSDQFQLTLGARFTEEERGFRGCTYDTGDGLIAGFYNFFVTPFFFNPLGFNPAPLAPGDCGVFNDLAGTPGYGEFAVFDDSITTDDVMYKASLNYSPNEDVLLYGTISTGFKSGGFNGAGALTHSQLQPYDKEELTSYELGLKSTLLGSALQLNAAAFMYDYTDKQELFNFISPVGDVVGINNVPESEVFGIEIESAWYLATGLRWDLGVAYLDSEILEFIGNCPAGLFFPPPPESLPVGCPAPSSFGNVLTFDASGNRLDNAPEWQIASTLSYTWSVGSSHFMNLAADVSYKDDNEGSGAAPTGLSLFYIPDYTIVNMRIGFGDVLGRWDVELWGRNVTDEEYWHSTSSSNSTTIRLNGMPATYGVSVGYKF